MARLCNYLEIAIFCLPSSRVKNLSKILGKTFPSLLFKLQIMFTISVFKICFEYKNVPKLFTFYQLWLSCFLSNYLQSARNAVLDNLIFQNFLGEDQYPETPLQVCGCGARRLVPTVRIRTFQYEILATGLKFPPGY